MRLGWLWIPVIGVIGHAIFVDFFATLIAVIALAGICLGAMALEDWMKKIK